MSYVYVVESHVDYEGSKVEGVYTDLREARNHKGGGGDWLTLTRWDPRNQRTKELPWTRGGKVRT